MVFSFLNVHCSTHLSKALESEFLIYFDSVQVGVLGWRSGPARPALYKVELGRAVC